MDAPIKEQCPSVAALFQKPKLCNPVVSLSGKYLVWLERDPKRTVLNFQASVFEPGVLFRHSSASTAEKEGLPGKKELRSYQLSFFSDWDACVFYQISADDRYIIFVREPILGKELYHLYTIDLQEALESSEWNESNWKYMCRTPDPELTCCIGFVGAVQLWVPRHGNPDLIRFATGRGKLFWDLSELNLRTNTLQTIISNPVQIHNKKRIKTFAKLLPLVLRTIGNLATTYLAGWLLAGSRYFVINAARVPVEWHLDRNSLEVRGKTEASLQVPLCSVKSLFSISFWASLSKSISPPFPGNLVQLFKIILPKPTVHCSWSCLYRKKWKSLNTVAFRDLNMHLVGSAAGTGKCRMDFVDEHFVDVHLCRKEEDFTGYERFDLRKSSQQSLTLARAVDSDVTGFLMDPVKQEVDAVIYEHDRIRISSTRRGEDPYSRLRELLKEKSSYSAKGVDADVPSFYPVSKTHDNCYWIVYAFSDRGTAVCDSCPDGYFLYENSQMKESRLILWEVPRLALRQFELGETLSFHVTTRDKCASILCFLTLPPKHIFSSKDCSSHKGIPLVVFPHGGPNWRDGWGYDPSRQVLSTRGLAVLQVQFRGSTGFGMKFMRDGMQGRFCTTMQEDIVDCVHHVLEEIEVVQHSESGKIELEHKTTPATESSTTSKHFAFDKNRIAILGQSFGGYCSLFGCTLLGHTSARFSYCCGVAVAALYKVGAIQSEAFRGDLLVKDYWRNVYGTEISDNIEKAKSVSPFYHVDKVQVPMLICHGDHDPRCPVGVADEFAAILEERNFVRYIRYNGEGHGLKKESNLIHQWQEIGKFLTENLLNDRGNTPNNSAMADHTASVVFPGKQY